LGIIEAPSAGAAVILKSLSMDLQKKSARKST
jgi:hypothetical protein